MQYYQEDQQKGELLPQAEGYNPIFVQASSIKKTFHVTLCLSTKAENHILQERKLHGHSGQHLLCVF